MVTLSTLYKRDYEDYKNYVKNRNYLFSTDANKLLENAYHLLFIFSSYSPIKNIDKKNEVKNYFNEVKNNLIIAFDLMNMNYLKASHQILRSAVESFFRLSLSISRYIEYRDNIKQRIFIATDSLKKLRSMIDTHKVWRLTNFTVDYFKEKPIESTYEKLYEMYGQLSSNVHVNKAEDFSIQEFLTEYSDYNAEKANRAIDNYTTVITCILISLYYLNYLLKEEGISLGRQQMKIIEVQNPPESSLILNNIDEHFLKKV